MTTVFPIAYISGIFSLPSQTFVHDEFRGLRARGWPVLPVSLHAYEGLDADQRLEQLIVYGPGYWATIASAVAEFFSHPLRSLRTFALALFDSIRPGEPTPLGQRIKLPAQAAVALGVARRLRAAGVRHIHCHFAHAPTTVGMYCAAQMKIPFSFTGHANDLFPRRILLRTKLRRAAFVACISQWHRQWYQSIQAEDSNKYEIIRCGVDVETWRPVKSTRQSTGETPLKIFTLCRLVEKKGVDTLIAAVAELNRRGRRAELTIAGDGPDQARLQALAADLRCGDWLRWIGAVDHSQVPAMLAASDIFALACRQDAAGDRDGIPVVLIEAMACGLPVVSGDLPSIRELIEDGVSGLLVDGNNPLSLADKLAMLWTDAALRRRVADAGRQRVVQEFSAALNLDRLERCLAAAQHA
ncbi:MAG: glycosyltransferase family 4 protein [Tepidisphaeraceae bacterium]